MTIRQHLIRLAHAEPVLRSELLQLLRTAREEDCLRYRAARATQAEYLSQQKIAAMSLGDFWKLALEIKTEARKLRQRQDRNKSYIDGDDPYNNEWGVWNLFSDVKEYLT